jgi:parallel beta-helix repeat protein
MFLLPIISTSLQLIFNQPVAQHNASHSDVTFEALSQVLVDGQRNFFVSPSGEDTNDGLSVATPFGTFDHAVSVLLAGDTLNVLPGLYTNATYGDGNYWKVQGESTIYVNNLHGDAANWITIRGYGNPDDIELRGDGVSIVLIKNSSYIRVENLRVVGETQNIPLELALEYQFTYLDENGDQQERVPPGLTNEEIAALELPLLDYCDRPTYFRTSGINVNSCHHVDVLGNDVSYCPGEGIRSFNSDHLLIRSNEVQHSSHRSSTGGHGLSVYIATSFDDVDDYSIVIDRNMVHHNWNEMFSWVHTKTWITPHIDEGKGITAQRCNPSRGWTVGRILMANNIAYENGLSGVHVNDCERIDLVNNTAYHNFSSKLMFPDLAGNNHGLSINDSHDITAYNNILVADPDPSFSQALSVSASSSDCTVDQNIVIGGLNSTAESVTTGIISDDPQFADAANLDFSLLSTSPAINAALPAFAPADDYFGNARDVSPDLGAIEFELLCEPFVDEDSDGLCDVWDNCASPEACNFDDAENVACIFADECGVCGGSGISEGECDCDGNLDANGNGYCDVDESVILNEPFTNDVQFTKEGIQFATNGTNDFFGIWDFDSNTAHDFDGQEANDLDIWPWVGVNGRGLVGRDLDNTLGVNQATLVWSGMDVSGVEGELAFSIRVGLEAMESSDGDLVRLEGSVDGGAWATILDIDPDPELTDLTTFETLMTFEGSTLDVRLLLANNNAGDQLCIDDLVIAGIPAVTCSEDFNGNGFVEVDDFLLLLSEFDCQSNCSTDLTGDGVVAVEDVLSWLSAFGAICEGN